MQIFKIKFNNIAVSKIDFSHKIIELKFNYSVNDNKSSIVKKLSLEDGIINFVRNVMNELKREAKEKYSNYLDDPIEGIVTVMFDEAEPGDVEEKLVKAVERIRLKLSDFKRTNYSSDYMSKFHELNSTIIDIK